ASEYLGTSRTVPDRQLNSLSDLEAKIGTIDDILGPIPRQEELLTEIKSIEDEIKAESDESTSMVGSYSGKGPKAVPEPVLPEPDEIAPPPPSPATRPASPSAPSTTNTASSPNDPRRRRPPTDAGTGSTP
ncbi:MAG TPA: hypothetical protein VMC82_00845, partial [Thermoplasmata archaeon]|nr:hypothetical protein [Thermoplasmata archaeon]